MAANGTGGRSRSVVDSEVGVGLGVRRGVGVQDPRTEEVLVAGNRDRRAVCGGQAGEKILEMAVVGVGGYIRAGAVLIRGGSELSRIKIVAVLQCFRRWQGN